MASLPLRTMAKGRAVGVVLGSARPAGCRLVPRRRHMGPHANARDLDSPGTRRAVSWDEGARQSPRVPAGSNNDQGRARGGRENPRACPAHSRGLDVPAPGLRCASRCRADRGAHRARSSCPARGGAHRRSRQPSARSPWPRPRDAEPHPPVADIIGRRCPRIAYEPHRNGHECHCAESAAFTRTRCQQPPLLRRRPPDGGTGTSAGCPAAQGIRPISGDGLSHTPGVAAHARDRGETGWIAQGGGPSPGDDGSP